MSNIIRIETLNQDNHDTWKIQMRALLVKNDAWGYVSGEIQQPRSTPGDATSEAALKEWTKNDEKAKSDVILSIAPSELKQIKGCETSRAVWQKLEETYQSKGPARKATLLKQLTLQRMREDDDVREHLKKFFDAVDKLAEMEVVINPDLLAIMLLYSLPYTFENFRCAIESRDELPNPNALRIKIVEESDARKSEVRDAGSNAMFVGRRREKTTPERKDKSDSNSGKRGDVPDKSKIKCYRCHRAGHRASECGRSRGKSRTVTKNADESNFFASAENTRFDEVLQVENKVQDNKWVLDSGCTSHLCKDIGAFVSVDKSHGGRLNLANSACTEIRARGAVRMTTGRGGKQRNINLHDALHVPDLRTNLLSVSKITDRGFDVIFKKERAIVVDEDGSVILTANRRDNLYSVRDEIGHECKSASEHKNREVKRRVDDFELWHRRLGHLNIRDLELASRSGIIPNKTVRNNLQCEICVRGKMSKTPFPSKSERKTVLLETVHTDVCGPMRVNSNGGAKYFVTFTDDYSKWCEVRFIKSKDEVFRYFCDFKALIEKQTGRKIKCVQSDNGREYVNTRFDEYLKAQGIKRRLAVAYNPQQNGVAERKNRTLLDTARCMLLQSGLAPSFWAEAIHTANYIRNRCPSKSLEGKSPFEKLTGRVPSAKHFKEFGCDAYYANNRPNKGKFEPRSMKGIFVGYSEDSKGYRIWSPNTRKVEIARDVRFFERLRETSADEYGKFDDITRQHDAKPRGSSENHVEKSREIDILTNLNDRENHEAGAESGTDVTETDDAEDESGARGRDATPRRGRGRPTIVRTGSRGRPRKQYNMVETGTVGTEEVYAAEIPLDQAISSAEADEWHRAIADELKLILKNDTWKLVKRPENARVIGSRVILRNKYGASGNLERRKARIVARGFSQRPGIDFGDTFAPVARLGSMRLMSALAANHDMTIHQLDVTAAYLNGDLEDEIFMEVPNHIEKALEILIKTEKRDNVLTRKVREMQKNFLRGDRVCRMRKALYGLKQAGRCWYRKLDNEMKRYGLEPSAADPCVYYKGQGEDALLVLIYVDDILVSSRDATKICNFKKYLTGLFEVRDLGKVDCCLGIEFRQSAGQVSLSQQGYIRDVLERFSMTDCKPASTPMETSLKLTKNEDPDEDERRLPYRELMGSLMYLAVGTRPDIAHAASALSQFNNCYGQTHWVAAKRVLRYLKGTMTSGLVYRKSAMHLLGYADADWGSCIEDRRSFTGHSFILGNAAISWDSKKQRTVALSSTEAEYMSLSEATKEAIYLRKFLLELGFDSIASVRMFCDNQSALKLSENPVFHGRTKHIDIRHHFVRSALTDKLLTVEYIPTDKMTADILTKGLPGPAHSKNTGRLGLRAVAN